MKACVYRKYGAPEVVSVEHIDRPVPGDKKVLIKVHASTVNRTDSGFRSAEYFISRFWSGLFRPKMPVLGCEFAGVIEELGSQVTIFKKGDKVFGFSEKTFGCHAEYLVLDESEAISLIPEGVDFFTAAAITEGSHYALVDIRAANVQKGDQVMVYGATGAIGSAAVQLLKHFGATVTAVGNTKNMELVRSLGADVVIDYQTQDFTRTETRFSFIFDAVGKSSFGQCKPLLTANGVYISTELGKNAENVFLALLGKFRKGKRVLFPLPTISKADTDFLKSLVESGSFKPVIDRYYPIDQIVEAYRYVESGQKTGNVILKVAD